MQGRVFYRPPRSERQCGASGERRDSSLAFSTLFIGTPKAVAVAI